MAMAVPGTSGVLGQGAEEQKGETARLVSVVCLELCPDDDTALVVISNSAVAESIMRPLLCSSVASGLSYLQASFVGAMAIADLVKTTLGPKGMVSLCWLLYYLQSATY